MIRSYADDGAPISVVVIDRSQRRNALTLEACGQLVEEVADAVSRRDRAVVLRGEGGHFCAGVDLGTADLLDFVGAMASVRQAFEAAPLAIVAAVEGVCLGAGLQLALACDLVVASPTALFGVPAARIGVMVDHLTVQRLSRLAGPGRAAALLLGDLQLDAAAALSAGLVQRTGTPDDAVTWARRIAELAPLTVAGHKSAIRRGDPPTPADLRFQTAFEAAWSSADAVEGQNAFLQRRPARFEGR